MNYNKIKTYCENKNIPIRELAQYCDISEVGLHQMIRNASMKVEVLEKICDKLQVPFDFFSDSNKTTIQAEKIYAASRDLNITKNDIQPLNVELMQKEIDGLKKELESKNQIIELYKKLLEKNN